MSDSRLFRTPTRSSTRDIPGEPRKHPGKAAPPRHVYEEPSSCRNLTEQLNQAEEEHRRLMANDHEDIRKFLNAKLTDKSE